MKDFSKIKRKNQLRIKQKVGRIKQNEKVGKLIKFLDIAIFIKERLIKREIDVIEINNKTESKRR